MKKEKRIEVRLPEKVFNRGKLIAKLYSKGNLSKWIRYAIEAAPRKHLK